MTAALTWVSSPSSSSSRSWAGFAGYLTGSAPSRPLFYDGLTCEARNVSGHEDPALAALDAHICAQLTQAASDYESDTDLQALLAAILDAERQS